MLVAVSNMPVKSVTYGGDISDKEGVMNKTETVTYHFETTPPISTYLVAFVVGIAILLNSTDTTNMVTYYMKTKQ